MKKNNLFVQAIDKFLLGVIIVGLLLFLSAGSLRYWQGWLLIGILFVPMFCAWQCRWCWLRHFLSSSCCFTSR